MISFQMQVLLLFRISRLSSRCLFVNKRNTWVFSLTTLIGRRIFSFLISAISIKRPSSPEQPFPQQISARSFSSSMKWKGNPAMLNKVLKVYFISLMVRDPPGVLSIIILTGLIRFFLIMKFRFHCIVSEGEQVFAHFLLRFQILFLNAKYSSSKRNSSNGNELTPSASPFQPQKYQNSTSVMSLCPNLMSSVFIPLYQSLSEQTK